MPRPPLPPRPPRTNRIDHNRLRAACWRGQAPADALNPPDRDELVQALVDARFTLAEIATHTGLTTYTASRIVERLKAHQTRTRGATR